MNSEDIKTLRDLYGLLQGGIITQEDFIAKKTDIFSTQKPVSSGDKIGLIQELQDLLNKKIITETEFIANKEQILNAKESVSAMSDKERPVGQGNELSKKSDSDLANIILNSQEYDIKTVLLAHLILKSRNFEQNSAYKDKLWEFYGKNDSRIINGQIQELKRTHSTLLSATVENELAEVLHFSRAESGASIDKGLIYDAGRALKNSIWSVIIMLVYWGLFELKANDIKLQDIDSDLVETMRFFRNAGYVISFFCTSYFLWSLYNAGDALQYSVKNKTK